jgi:hypothetical protein
MLSSVMLLLALCAAVLSVALTIRTYMPCPWADGWSVMADIAGGAKPWSFHWLWSQHSEHRIAMSRLLIWFDWSAFGGKNFSLLTEIYLVQILHLAAICYAIERFSDFPKPLKRILEGVFAFCLFHPYQAQNLTWAFQVSFMLAFAIGTMALLSVAFVDQIQARWRCPALLGAGLAPMLAGTCLASGLLIGPIAMALAGVKRISRGAFFALAALSAASILFYFWGYRTPPDHPSPLNALLQPVAILRYVLALLDTSWHFPFIASISLVSFAAWIVVAVRFPKRVSNFEWFCIAECSFMLATACLIACGRLQYGIAQAGESRYQTVAMIYWASLFSLITIAVSRWQPAWRSHLQMTIAVIALSSLLVLPPFWKLVVTGADSSYQACASVLHGDDNAAKQLDFLVDNPQETSSAAALLRRRWNRASSPKPQ